MAISVHFVILLLSVVASSTVNIHVSASPNFRYGRQPSLVGTYPSAFPRKYSRRAPSSSSQDYETTRTVSDFRPITVPRGTLVEPPPPKPDNRPAPVRIFFAFVGGYLRSFILAYKVRATCGIPPLLVEPVDTAIERTFFGELKARLNRMHTRSFAFGKTSAEMLGIFIGTRTLYKTFNGNKNDKFSTAIPGAICVAFISRGGGPQVMARNAAIAGVLLYKFGGKDKPKKEEPEAVEPAEI